MTLSGWGNKPGSNINFVRRAKIFSIILCMDKLTLFQKSLTSFARKAEVTTPWSAVEQHRCKRGTLLRKLRSCDKAMAITKKRFNSTGFQYGKWTFSLGPLVAAKRHKYFWNRNRLRRSNKKVLRFATCHGAAASRHLMPFDMCTVVIS